MAVYVTARSAVTAGGANASEAILSDGQVPPRLCTDAGGRRSG
jgi:hypothetical protein